MELKIWRNFFFLMSTIPTQSIKKNKRRTFEFIIIIERYIFYHTIHVRKLKKASYIKQVNDICMG